MRAHELAQLGDVVCCRPVCTPKRTSMSCIVVLGASDVGRDFGGDEPQVVEVVEIEELQVHGLGAGRGELVDALDDFGRACPPAALARSSSGAWPIASARRSNSASSLPTHTTCAAVYFIVSGIAADLLARGAHVIATPRGSRRPARTAG